MLPCGRDVSETKTDYAPANLVLIGLVHVYCFCPRECLSFAKSVSSFSPTLRFAVGAYRSRLISLKREPRGVVSRFNRFARVPCAASDASLCWKPGRAIPPHSPSIKQAASSPYGLPLPASSTRLFQWNASLTRAVSCDTDYHCPSQEELVSHISSHSLIRKSTAIVTQRPHLTSLRTTTHTQTGSHSTYHLTCTVCSPATPIMPYLPAPR